MISERIKQLREIHGDRQADLAKKLDITRSSINAWELGISVPSTKYLVELAQLYGVSTDYLLGIDNKSAIDVTGLTQKEIGAIIEIVDCFKFNLNKQE